MKPTSQTSTRASGPIAWPKEDRANRRRAERHVDTRPAESREAEAVARVEAMFHYTVDGQPKPGTDRATGRRVQ